MPMATIHKMGQGSDLYLIHFLDQRSDPGYGQGHPGGHPDQGLPGHGHPDQGLPSHGRPDQGLPGSGARPDQGLPGGRPAIPSQDLPSHQPPQIAPGQTLVLVRKDNKWKYAVIPQGQPAPTPLPEPPTGQPPTAAPKG